MSQSRKNYSVFNLYQSIIDDVVNGIREAFIEEKVDEKVLQDLRGKWMSKLVGKNCVEISPDFFDLVNTRNGKMNDATNVQSENDASFISSVQDTKHQKTLNPPVLPMDPMTPVPIHITLPRRASDPPNYQRQITVKVPAFLIQSNRLHTIFSLPTIQAALSLPENVGAIRMQEQINRALIDGKINFVGLPTDKTTPSEGLLDQVDGQAEETESSDESVEDNDVEILMIDLNDSDGNEGAEPLEGGQHEDRIIKVEDALDEEVSSDETSDVVVCQFVKISRTRNKWKFHLKNGIMSLNGKDLVFEKAIGDSEW